MDKLLIEGGRGLWISPSGSVEDHSAEIDHSKGKRVRTREGGRRLCSHVYFVISRRIGPRARRAPTEAGISRSAARFVTTGLGCFSIIRF